MNINIQKRVVEICYKKQGVYKTIANGNCMFPFITNRDQVDVYPYGNTKPKQGDIVLIFIKNNMYLHRIVKITKTNVITKGDSNVKIDDITTIDNIFGYVKRVESYNYKNRRLIKKIAKRSYKAGVYFNKMININRKKCLKSMRRRKHNILRISKKVKNND